MRKVLQIAFFILLFSCQNNNEKVRRIRAERMVDMWLDKQIEWTNNLQWKVMEKDTFIQDISTKPCKVLIYVDSTGCNECRLQPLEWKIFQDSLRANHVEAPLYFIFQTEDEIMLETIFVSHDLEALYARDHNNGFRQANQFSKEDNILVFLLDEDNKIELVGTPLFQPQLWKLYQKQIIKHLQ